MSEARRSRVGAILSLSSPFGEHHPEVSLRAKGGDSNSVVNQDPPKSPRRVDSSVENEEWPVCLVPDA